ncbi:MAG: hypothetical protein J6M53_02355 [Bacteroidaceae bacterium]|nr:hypothetical protein [Bacteroidaceae bacterium]
MPAVIVEWLLFVSGAKLLKTKCKPAAHPLFLSAPLSRRAFSRAEMETACEKPFAAHGCFGGKNAAIKALSDIPIADLAGARRSYILPRGLEIPPIARKFHGEAPKKVFSAD